MNLEQLLVGLTETQDQEGDGLSNEVVLTYVANYLVDQPDFKPVIRPLIGNGLVDGVILPNGINLVPVEEIPAWTASIAEGAPCPPGELEECLFRLEYSRHHDTGEDASEDIISQYSPIDWEKSNDEDQYYVLTNDVVVWFDQESECWVARPK